MATAEPQPASDLERAFLQAVSAYQHLKYVSGIDIGHKYVGDRRTAQPAIRLHVTAKKPLESLRPEERFPTSILGVPVDVLQRAYRPGIEGDPLPTDVAGAARFETLCPGISVSHQLCPSGTLGLVVRDDTDGSLALLTNWHVVADSSFAQPGDPVTQPSATDGGLDPDDTVASLVRWILSEDGDAAIARFTTGRPCDPRIRELGVVPNAIDDPQIGEVVVKCGRSTGVTRGRVEGRGVYFPFYRTRDRVGIHGFAIVPIDPLNSDDLELTMNGDSGSVWLREGTPTVVGLHFAGETEPEPAREVALACFARRVFGRLQISLPSAP